MRVSYVNLYMIDTETPDPDDLTGESPGDTDELAALLAPLPAAVVGPLVSRDTWALRAEQVASLRAEAPSIFDHERPITDEVHAVAEALHAAESLREFLVRASRGGYEVQAN